MESEFLDHIPWERQYYSDTIISQLPFKSKKCIMCKMCGISYSDEIREIPYHIMHLNIVHCITELTDHPERGFLIQKFIINELKSEAKCRTCKRVIKYNKYGLYLLKNHIEIYHGSKSDIYKLIMTTRIESDILDKYFIIGSEATCPKCELKMDMTDLNIHIVEKVEVLFDHYLSHRYEEKCFICHNRRKSIMFYLFCSNNFIIISKSYYDWNEFSVKIVNYCYTYK